MSARLNVRSAVAVALTALAGCGQSPDRGSDDRAYYGTLEPFAAEAVYFVVTDRFVDGDVANNHVDQGGPNPQTRTFDRPIQLEGLDAANIGYLGGDFQGIVDNADYIADMGFTALWITPIVDNPDEAFLGGTEPGQGVFTDKGKTGYHGYWGVNFFVVDEHLESPGLSFAEFTATLRDRHGLKTVLDVVCNHGSPSYTNPIEQPKFGELYAADGTLVADHQNRHPSELDPDNPLHAFYSSAPDLAELGDVDAENPDALNYFVDAYSGWLDQGAVAFRIDTIRHMPHSYWRAFSERIRGKAPGLFMFGESFSYDAEDIAAHTYPENGGVSVLDFPGQAAMKAVFAEGAPYSRLEASLHLESGVYQNPYELMSFYDNHDMPRLDADTNGFIDANNWLFTSRGIPVVYYGSEIGFQAGAPEHGGNRNYFGQERIDSAADHPIRQALRSIARVRGKTPALQRGLQINLEFTDGTAAFYRVLKHEGQTQTALVLLNKGDTEAAFRGEWKGDLEWFDELSSQSAAGVEPLLVMPHSVRVLTTDGIPNPGQLSTTLDALQRAARRPRPADGV